jgi:5-methylcytosine-specific restriction endonuclease McrA
MSNYVSREVWIDPASYEDYFECIPGLKYVQTLAPNNQMAKAAILIAVRHLYWTTYIPVAEIRDAYAPGMPTSAVVTMAGPARLNIVCRRCSGALYVTSRNSFNRVRKGLPYCDPQFTQLDICPGCRVQVASEAVRRCVDVTDPGPHDPRQDPEPSTADMAYSDYLQTADWKIRREGALKRAGFSCQVCSGNGELHVHHRTYLRRGNEAESDLIVLCATCHKLFHEYGRLAQGGRANP